MKSKDDLPNIKQYIVLGVLEYLLYYNNIKNTYLHHQLEPKTNDIRAFLETFKRGISRSFSSKQDESIPLKIDDTIDVSPYDIKSLTNYHATSARINPETMKYIKQTKKEVPIPDETYFKNCVNQMKCHNSKPSFNKNEWYPIHLSPEESSKAFELLGDFLKNPIQILRIRIDVVKQLVGLLKQFLICIQELTKDNPEILVMNVVRSEVFEDALFTINVETKTIRHTLLFYKDERMPFALPVYHKGYINKQDDKDRERDA